MTEQFQRIAGFTTEARLVQTQSERLKHLGTAYANSAHAYDAILSTVENERDYNITLMIGSSGYKIIVEEDDAKEAIFTILCQLMTTRIQGVQRLIADLGRAIRQE